MDDLKSILIVKMTAIGDVVTATPVAESIRKAYPEAHIAWLVDERCREAVIGNPYVDEILMWDTSNCWKGFRTALGVIKQMRSARFDVAIDFQGLAKSSIMAYLSGAKLRIGFANGREHSSLLYNRTLECDVVPHRMSCHRLLLDLVGIPEESASRDMLISLTEEHRIECGQLLAMEGVKDNEDVVALVPATTRRHKHWVEDRWAHVADAMSGMGLVPVFLGGPNDIDLVEAIRGKTKTRTMSLAGKTTLKVAAALTERARLTVAVDTGLMHISVAVGTPTVALYGPTAEWRNHTSRPNFTVVIKDFSCAPCYRKPTCENYDCMRAITVDDVMEAAAGLPAGPPEPGAAGEKRRVSC